MIQNNVDKWKQKSALDKELFFGKVMGMAKKAKGVMNEFWKFINSILMNLII